MLALEVKPRDAKESADTVRNAGAVPAVFYGPKEQTTPIAIDARKLEHVWKEAGETMIVTLKGVGEDKDTLIHDAQFHPVTGKLLHVDFYVLEKGKKVKIKVPLEFTGTAPAEKLGHIIVKALHEVEIEVTPQELPHSLSVDLSKLENVGDHIVVRDIDLPPSAALVVSADEIVASVKEFKEEPVEVAPTPETVIIGEEKVAEGAVEDVEEAKKPEVKKEEQKKETK
ncbi:50S ribosomal protein L25 [Candidatus Kaiserbacteria bacterium]|nr:50S ribosomal protein L25 [Candidatus Kaiserbacteria bacterium]